MEHETIPVESIKRGDILPSKSDGPVLSAHRRDDIRQVLVMHTGGYLWHGSYGDTVAVTR